MNDVLIKICGITNGPDALAAAEAGADWLGLIFVPDTPRCIAPRQATSIVQAAKAAGIGQMVGVFRNQPTDFIAKTAEQAGLDRIQLHGDETPGFCAALPRPVAKVFTLHPGESPDQLAERLPPYLAEPNVSTLLLDLPKHLAGNHLGEVLGKADLPEAFRRKPLLLAGGLDAGNVGALITRFQPDGVDVAAGVESAPGRKDTARMQDFCRAVRAASAQTVLRKG